VSFTILRIRRRFSDQGDTVKPIILQIHLKLILSLRKFFEHLNPWRSVVAELE